MPGGLQWWLCVGQQGRRGGGGETDSRKASWESFTGFLPVFKSKSERQVGGLLSKDSSCISAHNSALTAGALQPLSFRDPRCPAHRSLTRSRSQSSPRHHPCTGTNVPLSFLPSTRFPQQRHSKEFELDGNLPITTL